MINLKDAYLKLSNNRDDVFIWGGDSGVVFQIGEGDKISIFLNEDHVDDVLRLKEYALSLQDRDCIQYLRSMERPDIFRDNCTDLELQYIRELVELELFEEIPKGMLGHGRYVNITNKGAFVWWNLRLNS